MKEEDEVNESIFGTSQRYDYYIRGLGQLAEGLIFVIRGLGQQGGVQKIPTTDIPWWGIRLIVYCFLKVSFHFTAAFLTSYSFMFLFS